MEGTLVFDIESHQRDLMYSMAPEEFVRLMGYAWVQPDGSLGDVVLTTDLEELREQILRARWVIGHNIHDFDLRAVFGIESNIPMQLADEERVYDTWTHAVLVNPAPVTYTDRNGKGARATKPEEAKKWFSLDEQAHQLGVVGKTDKLSELSFEFGDPDLPKKERILDGYGKIPVDDERYQAYLVGDVQASYAIARALLQLGPLDDYALREQRIESRKATISSNGWVVNQKKATARRDALKKKRDEIVAMLVEKYDFPTEGKQPWRSNPGKDAIKKALAEAGVTEGTRPGWKRTQGGDVSLGGEVLLEITAGTEAEELGKALAELMGQRSLSQLALDSVYPDGRVHPEITMLQASGRWSTTNPGLTVWTSRGEGKVEKEYFDPDNEDQVLIALDLSNADARAVAALSGDVKYAERFEPGADGHMINAIAAWGEATVATDPKKYRQRAKVPGHGWGYRIGAKKLSDSTGMSLKEAKQFLTNMNKAFPRVVGWQETATSFAARFGYVENPWGRKMKVDKGREFTQAPALLGQSVTREIMCDAMLRMPHHVVRTIKAQIHDEMVFSVPRRNWEACRDFLLQCMQASIHPKGGQRIDFPASSGPAGENWMEATHGE